MQYIEKVWLLCMVQACMQYIEIVNLIYCNLVLLDGSHKGRAALYQIEIYGSLDELSLYNLLNVVCIRFIIEDTS